MVNHNIQVNDVESQYILPTVPGDDYGGGGGSGGGGVTYPSSVPENVYGNLETYAFGSKTVVGGWIEAIRGRDEVETIYFDDKRRLRVNFYDSSYGIYSAVGLSAKFQKKNWIGWSGTQTNTLVLGWEFVDFQSGTITPFTPPSNNPPSFPPIDIPGTTKKYKLVDLRFLNKEYKYYVDQGRLVQTGVKEIFDFARGKLGSSQENIAVWTYANLAKKVDGILVSKDEVVVHNDEVLRKTFNWKTGTLSLKLDAEGKFDISGNVSKPFEINSASVYGIAFYENKWKGIRIVKPKD